MYEVTLSPLNRSRTDVREGLLMDPPEVGYPVVVMSRNTGRRLLTSPVVGVRSGRDHILVETRNHTYLLHVRGRVERVRGRVGEFIVHPLADHDRERLGLSTEARTLQLGSLALGPA